MSTINAKVNTSELTWPLEVEEVTAGEITLSVSDAERLTTLVVNAEDLARALLQASPSFALGVGEIAQRAIVEYLEETKEP